PLLAAQSFASAERLLVFSALDSVSVGSPLLAGIEANRPDNPLAAPLDLRSWIGREDEFILALTFVLYATALATIRERGERTGMKALLLQRAVGGAGRLVADSDNGRKADGGEILLHDGQVGVGFRFLAAGVSEQDQIGSDAADSEL